MYSLKERIINARNGIQNTLRVSLRTLLFSIYSLSALLVVCVAVYIFFIFNSVVNASVAERLEQSIQTLSTEVSSLEFAYISKRNDITLEYARAKGFHAVAQAHFIELNSLERISRAQYEN